MKDEHLQDAFTSWVDMSRDSQGLLAYNARLKEVLDEKAMAEGTGLTIERVKEIKKEMNL